MSKIFRRKETGALATDATQAAVGRWYRDVLFRLFVAFALLNACNGLIARVHLPMAIGVVFVLFMTFLAGVMLHAIWCYARISWLRHLLSNAEWAPASGVVQRIYAGPVPLRYAAVVTTPDDPDAHAVFLRPGRFAKALPSELADGNMCVAVKGRYRVYASADGDNPCVAKRIVSRKLRVAVANLVQST